MGAPSFRTVNVILLVVSAVLLALQLSACSMATRAVAARQPAAAATQRPLDLMPSPTARTERDADQVAGEASGTVVSPDGTRIAFESNRDGVHGVWMARRDGEGARRVSGNRLAVRPTWSPDGERLVFLARLAKRDDWGIWVAEAAGDAPARKLASAGASAAVGLAWFPDSRHICYGSDEWLVVVDTEAAATRAFRLPTESARIAGAPAVSPDGRSIVFAVAGDGAWIVSMRDGSMTQLISERDVDAFAWAPGGRQVAFRTARDGQWRVQIVKNER